MQKIIIKNFGPVEDAEIEIKKVLVLIGEQASGKSTIAKLIYFFKSVPTYYFHYLWESISNDPKKIDIEPKIVSSIKYKFSNLFINLNFSQKFEVVYYYNIEQNKYLKLYFDQIINIEFSENFIDQELGLRIETARESYWKYIEEENKKQQDDLFFSREKYQRDFLLLESLLYSQFEKKHNDQLLMPASRSISVNYSDLFDKQLFAKIQNQELNQDQKFMSIDEFLLLEFIKKISTIKNVFRKIGSFEGGLQAHINQTNKQQIFKNVVDKIHFILKGKYIIDDSGEAILVKENVKIYLGNSSSGQQESIRILQDIFIVLYLKQKALRIIEEPEAHLFPVAQRELVELLALMVNYQPENQLIITTHSPYILSVFSNLLFASRVVEKNPAAEAEVQEIIDKDCWLNPQEFSAYSLGNQSFPEEMQYCEPIFDNKMGNIKQNYLDTVSEILGAEFSQLYSIHGKTFKRR
jgi:predicted ATP-dependent endonuclease of OLD family